MQTSINFEQVSINAAKQLRSLADQVEKARPIAMQRWIFNTADLNAGTAPIPLHPASLGTGRRAWSVDASQIQSDDAEETDLLKAIGAWAKPDVPYLYCFRLLSAGNADITKAFKTFSLSEERACARINAEAGDTLYVGSSHNLVKRLREHLGYGHAKTYALQLSHWARDLNLEIEISCAEYAKETLPAWVQALEDCAWEEVLPVFGRRGSK